MPEVNGVWLNPILQGREKIASIQKKANRYYFAQRAVKYGANGTMFILAGITIFYYSCWIYKEYLGYIGDRNIKPVNCSDSYFGKTIQNVRLLEKDMKSYGDYGNLDYTIITVILLVIFALQAIPRLDSLQNYFIEKRNDCINIIEDSINREVPDYEDMKYYDQVVNIDKTNVGPISCTPVAEIKQKVFYRREVYEYYYLLTAYSNNLNARDHTGQPYDISKFYRIDDNNIIYKR